MIRQDNHPYIHGALPNLSPQAELTLVLII